MSYAIQAHDVGKAYRLANRATVASYRTLREDLYRWPRLLWQRLLAKRRENEVFWALQGIGFEIKEGEVCAIVGKNGAGKSTLLKILSRLTEPTTGCIRVTGRVGSLLEVGTGFHPELTGRENIFLSGALLGMTKAEVRRHFDEIVAFAEVDRFIDTPCKHYSSGMYTRLGFAVAAHLSADILLVDEVLAVGDAAFQRRCLGKMNDVAKSGRTILFVSHNLSAVRQICSRALVLRAGQVVADDAIVPALAAYRESIERVERGVTLAERIAQLPSDEVCEIVSVRLEQAGQASNGALSDGELLKIHIEYRVRQPVAGLRVFFDLLDEQETILLRSFHDEREAASSNVQPGSYVSEATVSPPLFAPKNYDLWVRCAIYNVRTCQGGGLRIPITVEATIDLNRGYPGQPVRSALRAPVEWSTGRISRHP
jgi:lipopolysaccharide transport system ATP-binding protein